MNISTYTKETNLKLGKTKKFYLAVTLANRRHVTDVVINECKTSQRQTIIAKIKPINVEDHAFKFA